jgi:hypothetical protein
VVPQPIGTAQTSVDPELAGHVADRAVAVQDEVSGVAAELLGTSLVKLIFWKG